MERNDKHPDRTVDYEMERPELESQNVRVEERDMTRPDYPVEGDEPPEGFHEYEDIRPEEPIDVRVVGPLPVGQNTLVGNIGSYTITDERAVRILGYDTNRKRAVISVLAGETVFLLPEENTIRDFGFVLDDNNGSVEITYPGSVWAITAPTESARVSVLYEYYAHE